jgi:Family of unknown function (DUF6152)
MRLRMVVAMFAVTFAASVMPLAAHHSVPATFDISKEITIQGVVTKIEWRNPHTRFWVEARNDDGTVSNWEVELAPPNALKRSLGLDFIKAGDQVTVVLFRARDGSRLANGLGLTVPDGRVFNFPRNTDINWEMPASPK